MSVRRVQKQTALLLWGIEKRSDIFLARKITSWGREIFERRRENIRDRYIFPSAAQILKSD
jgi:ribosomal protein L34